MFKSLLVFILCYVVDAKYRIESGTTSVLLITVCTSSTITMRI